MTTLAPLKDISSQPEVVWPTEAQQLLLQAALLEAPIALPAWERWQKLARLDALDIGSWRLIPLAYVNLRRLGAADPLLAQARACHLYQWTSNQKLFHHAADFLDEAQRLGIVVLFLKGVPLAQLYYPDTGARPMADLDVLVRVEQFAPLAKHLWASGWKSPDFRSFEPKLMPSVEFIRGDRFSVDIHCHVLHSNCADGADEEFWNHAQSWTFKQRAALTLAPEDHLLHVISHGVRWCGIPPFRWMADAWWILNRRRDEFDWERLIEQARFHEVNLQVLHGLEFLDRITPLRLPAGLLERLEAIPTSAEARIQFVLNTHRLPSAFFPKAVGLWKALWREPKRFKTAHTLFLFACAFRIYVGKVLVRNRGKILGGGIPQRCD